MVWFNASNGVNLKSFLTKNDNKHKLSFNELFKYLTEFISTNKIEIIHVHSLSSPKLIELCLKLAPVVRSMHEPRMICPARKKESLNRYVKSLLDYTENHSYKKAAAITSCSFIPMLLEVCK